MIALTQPTAVGIANQVFDDRGHRFPWSFVAVPGKGNHELKLRLIQVEADVDLSATVSYARPRNAFYAECSRTLAALLQTARHTIATRHNQPHKLRDEIVTEVGT